MPSIAAVGEVGINIQLRYVQPETSSCVGLVMYPPRPASMRTCGGGLV